MPSRSGLPLGSMSSSPAGRTVFGASAPSAGAQVSFRRSANAADAFRGAVGHGHVRGQGLAPLGGRHAGDKSRPHAVELFQLRLDMRGGNLDAAGDDDVVGPAEHGEPAVGVQFAEVVGPVPADAVRPR